MITKELRAEWRRRSSLIGARAGDVCAARDILGLLDDLDATERERDEWERAGRNAWSHLMETSPEGATPGDLVVQAEAVEDALGGVNAHRAADGVVELRARAEKAEARLADIENSACARSDHAHLAGENKRLKDLDAWQSVLDEVERLQGHLANMLAIAEDVGGDAIEIEQIRQARDCLGLL